MKLQRIRDYRTARTVAEGIRRYNGVAVSPGRLLARPHFTIVRGSDTAGWIGFEGRGGRKFELVHLSVKPRFRHLGLAQNAVLRTIGMVQSAGGKYAFARINSRNRPSICLARKLGFRKVRGGSACIFGRAV